MDYKIIKGTNKDNYNELVWNTKNIAMKETHTNIIKPKKNSVYKYKMGMEQTLADLLRPNMDVLFKYDSAAVLEENGVKKGQ